MSVVPFTEPLTRDNLDLNLTDLDLVSLEERCMRTLDAMGWPNEIAIEISLAMSEEAWLCYGVLQLIAALRGEKSYSMEIGDEKTQTP